MSSFSSAEVSSVTVEGSVIRVTCELPQLEELRKELAEKEADLEKKDALIKQLSGTITKKNATIVHLVKKKRENGDAKDAVIEKKNATIMKLVAGNRRGKRKMSSPNPATDRTRGNQVAAHFMRRAPATKKARKEPRALADETQQVVVWKRSA